ncbi:MAG: TIGR00282 family metallophosphoesterase [Clostridiales bacterium]|nr:TIGR00282 family metallophosphoesterase [Clostridiales bacterium]
MRILFVGDIVGQSGRSAFATCFPEIKSAYKPDFVVVNAENSAAGLGITSKIAKELFDMGVDVITLGNHTFSNRDFIGHIKEFDRIARPANVSPEWPGKDYCIVSSGSKKIAVINLMGQIEAGIYCDNPFLCADKLIDKINKEDKVDGILVDFHAEMTSEKMAMGYYLDGKVTAVVGTHTHVQTADEEVLSGGTAYITDAGMCGATDSILGMDIDASLMRLVKKIPARYEPAKGPGFISGVVIDADDNGNATNIKRFREFE